LPGCGVERFIAEEEYTMKNQACTRLPTSSGPAHRTARLLAAIALALAVAGCSTAGGQIDVIGAPRKTENGQTTNRRTIYKKAPTATPSPTGTTSATGIRGAGP
jgi:hypothetical protein